MANSVFVWPGLFANNGSQIVFTLPVALPDGSASAPSLTFANDTTIGWYRPTGGGQVALGLSGSKIADFRSTGLSLDATGMFISWPLGTILNEDAANTIALRNGGTLGSQVPQTANIYSYWASATDNYRLSFVANPFSTTSSFDIGLYKGSGTADQNTALFIGNETNGAVTFRTNASSIWQFSAAGNFVDQGSHTITAGSTITTGANTTAAPCLTLTHGSLLTTATADAMENDAVATYTTIDTTNGRRFDDNWNYFRLTGSGTGITTIADFFGSNDGIPLVANGTYEIEWYCYFSQATAGIATWTIVTATTALANLTGEYWGSNIAGIGTVGAPQTAAINTTATSSAAFPNTGTEATGTTHFFVIRALLTAGNGASNTRLRLAMSAGTATPLINSYYRVRRLPAANTGTFVS